MSIFYVAEMFDDRYPMFCMDTNGYTLLFDTEDEAEEYAKENCQKGVVVTTPYTNGYEQNEKEAKIAEIAYIYAKKGKFFVPEADLVDMYNILYTPIYENWNNLPTMIKETHKSYGVVGYITEYTNEVMDLLNKDIGGEVSDETLVDNLNKAFKSIIKKYNGGV